MSNSSHESGPNITPEFLDRVAYENIRNNQIGGETDGMSRDEAEDLGFSTSEQLERAKEQVTQKQETAQKAAQVICGDCLEVIPCQHVGVTKQGKRYTRGE